MDLDLCGVVPSLEDLTWSWEELPDGAFFRELLLSTPLRSPQKPSVAFVEAYGNAFSEYEQEQPTPDYENLTPVDPTWSKQATGMYDADYPLASSYYECQQPVVEPFYQELFKPADHIMNQEMSGELLQQITTEDAGPDHSQPSTNGSFPEVESSDLYYRDGSEALSSVESSAGSSYSWESLTGSSRSTPELSQDEIFEEIQRECAEIERRSQSPRPTKPSRTKKLTRSQKSAEERKKELNRIAAAKYREKKRTEREGRQSELQGLESRNRTLKAKFESLENEIKYLKGLIFEIRARQPSS